MSAQNSGHRISRYSNIWDELFASSASISQARLEAVLALSADAIITIDEKGIVETFGGSSERIFGYSPAEIIGKSVNKLMPEPHAGNHDDYMKKYLRTGETKVIGIGRETIARKRNGDVFPVALAVIESVIHGRRVFTGVLRDLTETKRVERELNEHRARLEILVAERTAALLEANRQLRQLALTDPLTGVANRRKLDEVLEAELSRSWRNETPMALILCDVDHFKQYNDCYGHAAGDDCLCSIARVLSEMFRRAGEVCARYGGEEFAVVLPAVTAELVQTRAETARQAVWNLHLEHAASPVAARVTLSIGVVIKEAGKSVTTKKLLNGADAALYRAKQSGRNRTVVITL